MKRLPFAILASLIVLLGSWSLSYAATSVFLTTQGGTGTSSPSGILYGDNGATGHLNTVTLGANCTFVGGVLNCTSSSVFPFTPATNFGVTVVSTSTPIWDTAGLMASSTSYFDTLNLKNALGVTSGGTGLSTYTLGDTLYASAANTLSALPGNTTTAQLFLSQTGTGSASAAPSWQAIPVAGSKAYYAYATQATSSSAYYNMNPIASTTSTTVAYPLTVSPQTVQNWITPTGDPGVSSIPGGNYIVDLFAWRSSGSASITLAVQVWEVSSTGADVSLIGTTNSTPNLTGSKTQYQLAFTTGTHAMASTNNRILMRVIATTSGTPTLSLAMGDGDQMDLVTPGITVDTSTFVPYTGATKNLDLGAFNASTTQLTVVGPEWITSLGTPAGSVLAVDPNGKIIATTTSSGTVTSVSGSGGTTGLTLTGGPITTSGTLTLGGTLGIANGGTGTTTGGVTNGVEYYNGTTLTNGSNFIFDGTNVGIGTTTPVAKLSVNGAIHAFGQFLASSTDSALLPGYSWLGDLTTGMFHPLQSVIAWAIGGAEKMRLTSTGLGIASTTPNFLFSVNTGSIATYITSGGEIVGYDLANAWNGRINPTKSFALQTGTTTAWTASTTGSGYSPSIIMPFTGTLRDVRCKLDQSFLGVNVTVNGSNATPSYFVASTTVGTVPFTSGNTFTAGQEVLANFGTTTTAGTLRATCTFDVTETP